ncbi:MULTISPECIES: hypothetical protein [unclassified Crossiella]|uniref:hypothetical protein n=1 Tax=unclassified Crossiella TaxID=2620835 RepID=UPI001FFFA767|nr:MULTISPECIES: hypothetical protein [unclassified Crossiella]MCK2239395.1 hypothetical protein [Crossiella sp. S99.2]MCK2252090.1 hypothetical protein [Crossiella sp. S99.1]
MTAAAVPPLASLAELETRMRRPLAGTPDEDGALAALADASALVRAEVPPALLIPTTPPAVVAVVCQSAARAVRNPDGFQSETAGQYTYRYGDPAVTGVYLTEEERAVLRRLSRRSGLRSTRTPYGAGEHTDPPYRLPVLYRYGRTGEPFPWEDPPAPTP